MRIIVFDIEIAKRVEDVPGGWNAARRGDCGISCVCLFDNETNRYHVYDQHTIVDCIEHLNKADLLVSFNGQGFDIPALEGYAGLAISVEQHYDILAKIWEAAGRKVKGYRLGEVGERTIGMKKSDTGTHAPELYARGRWAELVDYCINDVHLTRELFNFICMNGFVMSPDAEEFHIEKPDIPEEDILL